MPPSQELKEAMYAASEPLARSLGQTPRCEGNVIRVPSRTRSGHEHTIRIGIDGAMACNCEAGMNNLDCWALKYAREELHMTTETALVPVPVNPPKALIPSKGELASIKETAAMALAGAISLPEGIKTKEQAAALMLYGWELGLPPMTSLQKLYIVKGRVSPSTEVMAGLVMRHEPDIRLLVEELTDKVCTMRIQRPSRKLSETYTVTWDEIIKAGLQGGANANYPRDRLRYHCTKRILRIYCPDLINNLDGPVINAAATLDDEDEDALAYRRAFPSALEPSTPEQRREVGAYWSHATDAKRAAATDRWPHVFPKPGPGVMNQLARLTQQDADEVLAFFQDVDPPPVETGPAAEQNSPTSSPPANVSEGLVDPEDLPWDAPEQSLEDIQAEVTRLLTDSKASWQAKEYGPFYNELAAKYTPGKTFKADLLTEDNAATCLEYIRAKRGEGQPAPSA